MLDACLCFALFVVNSLILPGAASAQGRVLRARERLRIGGAGSPPDALFAQPPDALIGPDGSLYAREPGYPSIRVFSASGDLVAMLGRRGRGPGEFERPHHFGFVGDSLWVTDVPSNRVTVFDLDGNLVRTFQAEARFEGYGSPRPIEALLVGGRAVAVPYNPPPGKIERVWAPLEIGPVESPQRRKVFEVSRPPGLLVPPVLMRGVLPFPIPPLFAIAPDGSRVDRVDWVDEDPSHLVITSFAPTGDVAREISIPYRARATPESFVEQQIDAIIPGVESALSESARLRGESPPHGVRKRVQEAVAPPHFLPPVDEALIDAEGRLWVRTFSTDPTQRRWSVVADDQIAFCVEGLATADVQTAKGDTVWAVEVDQLDVPTLVAYALEDADASEGIPACGLD